MAAATALTFAKDLGFQHIILEGDSLEVIQALWDKTKTLTPTRSEERRVGKEC